MPLVGTLSTMPLSDLLQWLGTAGKTGTLQIQWDKATRVIRMREGRVIGCRSDAPEQRLGQFLLAHGKINEHQLSVALDRHLDPESGGACLGRVLVDMQLIEEEDLLRQLEAKAEEIIHSLFDCADGQFRFEESLEEQAELYPVDLRVEDVMLRGLRRVDRMARIRQVFPDRSVILRYTAKPPGPEIFGDERSRRMYAAIDGERTIEDIVLHLHGADFAIHAFLFELHGKGLVEVTGVRSATPPEPSAACAVEAETDVALESIFAGGTSRSPATEPASGTALAIDTSRSLDVCEAPTEPQPVATEIEAELTEAGRLMSAGEYENALEILDALYRENPGDDSLRRLTAEAEACFVDRAYRHFVPAAKVPILTKPVDSLGTESLTPEEFFMLSRIDGTWDVRSIIQVSPFREVDALRTLKRMRESGLIELRDPA